MACTHEKIKSVNCVIFCSLCGEKLPIDYLVGRERIAAQKAEEPAPEVKPEDNTPEPVKAAEKPKTARKTATKAKK